ncbi:hypothetical protein AKJ09_06848 [Labilithrix luteola]|uniref:Uncharacterized protein n=1 Tax=Labilithrix luteola TaxID=1391654 RepID=A0A0K1Q474_9BACT|nr:hypothetical protein AKJ09_06848 [Labilithrix luteola]
MLRRVAGLALVIPMLLFATGPAWGAENDESEWSLDDLDRHLLLEWDAPAECPTAHDVRERIRTLLKIKSETDHRVRANAKVTPTAAGYALDLSIADGAKRELRSETCRGLVEAASIIIALDIETHAKAPEPTVEPPPSPPPAQAVVVSKRSSKRRTSAPVAADGLGLAVGAMTLGDVGSLPGPTAAYRAMFALGYRAFRVQAGATVFAPRNADGVREGTGVRIDLTAGMLQLCRAWNVDHSAMLDTCLGGEVGASTVTGFGITHPSTSTGVWTSVVVSSQLRFRWARPLFFGLEAGAVTSRATAVIRGQGIIFDPPPWLARAMVGVEFEILPPPRMK